MRKDDYGMVCPETLGEYYDFCCILFGVDSKPAKFLEEHIKLSERDTKVVAPDPQMFWLLTSMAKEGT